MGMGIRRRIFMIRGLSFTPIWKGRWLVGDHILVLILARHLLPLLFPAPSPNLEHSITKKTSHRLFSLLHHLLAQPPLYLVHHTHDGRVDLHPRRRPIASIRSTSPRRLSHPPRLHTRIIGLLILHMARIRMGIHQGAAGGGENRVNS